VVASTVAASTVAASTVAAASIAVAASTVAAGIAVADARIRVADLARRWPAAYSGKCQRPSAVAAPSAVTEGSR
jgi:hypothetical protein